MNVKPIALGVLIAATLASGVQAQTPGQGRQIAKQIAADLGLQRKDVKSCVKTLDKPAERGTATDEQRAANKEKLITCLQQVNPELSEELISATIDKYRPQ